MRLAPSHRLGMTGRLSDASDRGVSYGGAPQYREEKHDYVWLRLLSGRGQLARPQGGRVPGVGRAFELFAYSV